MTKTMVETTMSGNLKHDKFYPLKRKTMHNACWDSSSSAQTVPNGRDLQVPVWPLGTSLKEQTRQALFREFGLKDRIPKETRHATEESLQQFRKTTSHLLSLSNKSSSNTLLHKLEARMRRQRNSQEGLHEAKSFSSHNCGLRRSRHLASIRPATVVALQPMMKRASIFRQAIKQQQS